MNNRAKKETNDSISVALIRQVRFAALFIYNFTMFTNTPTLRPDHCMHRMNNFYVFYSQGRRMCDSSLAGSRDHLELVHHT